MKRIVRTATIHKRVFVVIVAVMVTGCGSGGGGAGTTGAGTAISRLPRQGPLDCLRSMNMRDAKRIEANLWHGFDPYDGTIILIHRWPTHRAAVRAARQADLVSHAAVGRYSVTGPVTSDKGGASNVRIIARCLS